MTRKRPSQDDGFALIEAIAVLALSALVLVSLLIASNLVARNAGAAARRANAVENLSSGLEALRRDIARARFIRSGPNPEAPILFQGTAQSLGFAVGADGADLGENLIWIEARSDARESVLVRTSARLLPQMTSFAEASFANPAVLLSGPWKYRLSYADVRGPPQWLGAWGDVERLPGAVRLEVLNARSGNPILPPVVMPLRIDAEVPCEDCEEEELDEENEGELDDPARE